MNATELLWSIGRATIFTSVSVLVAITLVALLRIRSPRLHRAAWFLAILPSWLLVPWTWRVEAPPAITPAKALRTFVVTTATLSHPAPTVSIAPMVPAARMSPVQRLLVVYLGGVVAVLAIGLSRYIRFVRRLPRSTDALDPEWQQEWQRQLRALRVGRPIDLCVTLNLGPLLCFVPYRYLVLVPRPLWTALTRAQRVAILRHELAHWRRGDLWWSLAIRALALPQWFNPLAWLAMRRFDEASEWACDDLVSRGRRGHALAFARSLLATAEYATANSPGTAAIQGGQLARRVRRLVSQRFKEEAMMKKFLLLLPLAAIVLLQAVRIERVIAEEQIQSLSRPANEIGSKTESTSPTPRNTPPAYIIEPPDVLLLNAVKVVPKPPHQIEPYDALLVRATGALPDQPIADAFAVDSEGKIDLGPTYGRIEVSGMTIDEARDAIQKQLQQILQDPQVSVSIASSAAAQLIVGKHLVGPDGRVNLGTYGTVYVAGMTIDEARQAIEEQLAQQLRDPKVVVDVANYNSKKYYVITRRPGHGDNVFTAPITGSDTVLDALALVDDALKQSMTKIWISRPSDHGDGPSKILPVRWDEIVDGASMATNYQLGPGDRLFIVNSAPSADPKPAPPPELDEPQPPSLNFNMAQGRLKVVTVYDSKSAVSVQFNIDMIEDRTDALAEYVSRRGAAPFVALDSETIGPALRVLSKHDLIQKTASPKITCLLGDTATMEIKGVDTEPSTTDHLSLQLSARKTDLGMLLDLHLKGDRVGPAQGINFEAYLKPGQALLVPIAQDPLKSGAEEHAKSSYIVVTPSFLPLVPPTAASTSTE